jgi:autotransporter translocation and assembly factor TamB
VNAFPVASLADVMPAAAGWDGRVAGTLALSGSPARPVLDVDSHADRFGWHDVRAERVDLRAHYENGRLEARDLRARMQNVESSARLNLPLRLALGMSPEVPDEPVSGRVDLPAGDLQVLPLLVPQLESARGRFDLAAEISGTAHAPHVSGKCHIRDGVVRPANRSEVIEGLSADLHFDQSRISLDTLSARQGRTGRLWSSGAVLLDRGHLKSYRFGLAMRDFAASEEGLYALLFDGDFVVSDGPLVGGERLPQVTGQARIKKGVIEFDFANQTDVQKRAATTQPLYWTYRIQAEATSNLRWRPPDADIEFNAALDLQQTPDSLLIFGEMHALRGTYSWFVNRFKILNADLTFDNQKGVDPLLDITAETRLVASDPPQTITAQLSGRSSQPIISLASTDPKAEQKSILQALTVGSLDPRNLVTSASNPLDNYFTRQLNAQLSAGLSEFFKGAITDWELQRDQGGLLSGQGAYVLGVGSQVTDKLALRYRQRLLPGTGTTDNTTLRLDPTDLFEQNVEAEYRINRFIFVTSGVSRRRNTPGTTAQPNTDYNLNLKARWEY